MKIDSFQDLMRLASGFQQSKILFTAVDLDLFSHLQKPAPVAAVAGDLKVDARALELLMNALVAMGLLEKNRDLFGNGPLAAQLLVAGEGYRGSILRHIHHCWDAWSRLPLVVREGQPPNCDEDKALGSSEEWTRDFIRGMDDVTRDLAPQVVRQLDLGEARVLIDVGGGPGTYAAAFLEAHPQLERVVIFDLPGALGIGREKLAAKGLLDRVTLVEGDFHRDGLGNGACAIWLSQVLHSQDEAGCRMLIDKSWHALRPGGQLLIHEFLLDDSRTAPLRAAVFAVHMLAMTQGGRSYSGGELAAWMAERGFHGLEVCKVSEETGMVRGTRPA